MTTRFLSLVILPTIGINLLRHFTQSDSILSKPSMVTSLIALTLVSMICQGNELLLYLDLWVFYPLLTTIGCISACLMLVFLIFPQNKYSLAIFIVAQGLMGCLDWMLGLQLFWVLALNFLWLICVIRFKVSERKNQYDVIEQTDMKQAPEQTDMKMANDNNV